MDVETRYRHQHTRSQPSGWGDTERLERDSLTMRLLDDAAREQDVARRRELRDEVVLVNRCLAERVARRYRGRGVDVEDLEQIALLGLCKAVQGYDVHRGPTFTGYAMVTMSGEVKRYFRDHGWLVRPNRAVQDLCVTIRNGHGELAQRLGRQPSAGDVAAELGIPVADVRQARKAEVGYTAYDLDQPVSGRAGRQFEQVADPNDAYVAVEERIWLREAVDRLPHRERLILHLRMEKQLSQSAIGDQIGISQMRVSRILRRVISTLRDQARLEAQVC